MKSTVPFLNVAVPAIPAIPSPGPAPTPEEPCEVEVGVTPAIIGVDVIVATDNVRDFVETGNPDANKAWEIGYAEPSEPDA